MQSAVRGLQRGAGAKWPHQMVATTLLRTPLTPHLLALTSSSQGTDLTPPHLILT